MEPQAQRVLMVSMEQQVRQELPEPTGNLDLTARLEPPERQALMDLLAQLEQRVLARQARPVLPGQMDLRGPMALMVQLVRRVRMGPQAQQERQERQD